MGTDDGGSRSIAGTGETSVLGDVSNTNGRAECTPSWVADNRTKIRLIDGEQRMSGLVPMDAFTEPSFARWTNWPPSMGAGTGMSQLFYTVGQEAGPTRALWSWSIKGFETPSQ